jgi:hypothetical protein
MLSNKAVVELEENHENLLDLPAKIENRISQTQVRSITA